MTKLAISGGFFPSSRFATAKKPIGLVAQCGSCGLYKDCHSPKIPVDGEGRRKILLCGEAPSSTEDQQGRPFVGNAGQYLRKILAECGVDMRRDCWITNSVICFAKDGTGKSRNPTEKEVRYCRPNLLKAIEELKPEIIIPLGKNAVLSILGHLWKEDVGPISRWVGWQIPSQIPNAWLCPTYHPSYLLRQDNNLVLERTFKAHLEAAVMLPGRPWRRPPDYKARVHLLLDDKQAADAVGALVAAGKPVAFDFETDRLKPDHPDATIISCALANGKVSIAYPWYGQAITATEEFLRSPCPKIGYNLKFEERWARAKLGVRVKNWIHDGMLAAHVLDNRRGITSLKFQAYVLLGVGDYDSGVKHYLQGEGGGNDPNRIKQIDLRQLLHYNAMDSLLEYKVAVLQMKEMGLYDSLLAS